MSRCLVLNCPHPATAEGYCTDHEYEHHCACTIRFRYPREGLWRAQIAHRATSVHRAWVTEDWQARQRDIQHGGDR